jgi:hypothetical protein
MSRLNKNLMNLIEKLKSMLSSIVEGPKLNNLLDYMLGTTDGC